jgi:hypothetical protein
MEKYKKGMYQESPLRRSSFTPNLSKIGSVSTLLDPMDPFVFDTPSSRLRKSIIASPPSTSPESDSPVMRTAKLSDPATDCDDDPRSASLLAEPFMLSTPTWSSPRVPVRKRALDEEQDDDKDEQLNFAYVPLGERLKIASPVSHCRRKQTNYPELSLNNSPSTSRGSSSSSDARTPLRKRRRTLVD